MITGPYTQGGAPHPVLASLAESEHEFQAIGSRYVGGLSPLEEDTADYDFFYASSSSVSFPSEEGFAVSEWLESLGFQTVEVGGYTEDRRLQKFLRWTGGPESQAPVVDVLLVSVAEAERRMRVFNYLRMHRLDYKTRDMKRGLKGNWPAFWQMMHKLESK